MIHIIMNSVWKNRKWYLLIILLLIFFFLTKMVFYKDTIKIDVWFYNFAVKFLRNDNITYVMKIITNLGSGIFLILVSIICLIFIKNKKLALCIPLNLIIITILNLIIKVMIQRERPIGYRLIEETGYSFPSGHSMVTMAFYGFIVYFIYKSDMNKALKTTICLFLCLLILLVGFSRIYLGVHYASDVLAGFLVSIIYLILYITIVVKKIKELKNEKV